MSSIFGVISVETPKFSVDSTHNGYEIRTYEEQIRSEFTYTSGNVAEGLNSPFRTLAGYIFGKNKSRQDEKSEKVAMTAPVVVQRSEKIEMTGPVVTQKQEGAGLHKMAFIMPSKFKLETLPVPTDASVQLTTVPAHTVAAVTFSGRMTASIAAGKEDELRTLCQKDGINLDADPAHVQYCQFNPPWTLPFLRKNEILIPVLK